jgi:hypothetical protein
MMHLGMKFEFFILGCCSRLTKSIKTWTSEIGIRSTHLDDEFLLSKGREKSLSGVSGVSSVNLKHRRYCVFEIDRTCLHLVDDYNSLSVCL